VTPNDIPPRDLGAPLGLGAGATTSRLRLYIARATPNSVRAQHNLAVALHALQDVISPELEIIDVFSQPKRAIIDGVVVTPTLIGTASSKRVVLMGDLADQDHLQNILKEFLTNDGPVDL
jgi:circadian clock protein KaiB